MASRPLSRARFYPTTMFLRSSHNRLGYRQTHQKQFASSVKSPLADEAHIHSTIGNFRSALYTRFPSNAFETTGIFAETDNMNDHFMTRAIQLSIENARSARGGPFGAVVARGTEIIAEGANEVTVRKDPTAHAEVIAIRKACETLKHIRAERMRSLCVVRTLSDVLGGNPLGSN